MKKLYIYMIAALLTYCQKQHAVNAYAPIEKVMNGGVGIAPVDSIKLFTDQARHGDRAAYLKLADCYRNGTGVKRDFLGMMSMVYMAEQCGAIGKIDDYINSLPDSDAYKSFYPFFARPSLIVDSIDCAVRDILEFRLLLANIKISEGDTIGGMVLAKQIANDGCVLAKVFLMMPNIDNNTIEDAAMLSIAEDLPIIYALLGDKHYEAGNDGSEDEALAIKYYMKAEEHAMLNKRRAKRVLDYHMQGGGFSLTAEDVKRLELIISEQAGVDE